MLIKLAQRASLTLNRSRSTFAVSHSEQAHQNPFPEARELCLSPSCWLDPSRSELMFISSSRGSETWK